MINMKNIYIVLLVFFLVPYVSMAESVLQDGGDDRGAYRDSSQLLQTESIVPTVYEYTLPEDVEVKDIQIYDVTTQSFQQNLVNTESYVVKENTVVTTSLTGNAPELRDLDPDTMVDFPLPQSGKGVVDISYSTQENFSSSQLYLQLAENVSRPDTVSVFAEDSYGVEQVILAPSFVRSGRFIKFPLTESNAWRVHIEYRQPLRLVEAGLILDNPERIVTNSIRFLAQPNHEYVFFTNSDRAVSPDTGEVVYLGDSTDTALRTEQIVFSNNSLFVPSDKDGDGIIDVHDNCVSVKNTDQLDIDDSGTGDACDDFDKDGQINSLDNCPDDPNRGQQDEDGDGVGDVCDDEESRITEKYAWIPWVGLGFAALVLVSMFAIVLRRPKEEEVILKPEEESVEEVTGV
jgi:hypothetical protein